MINVVENIMKFIGTTKKKKTQKLRILENVMKFVAIAKIIK